MAGAAATAHGAATAVAHGAIDFEQILQHVGGWGRGQLVLLLASSASWATLGFVVLSMVFTTHTPEWDCVSAADAQCVAARHQPGSGGLCGLRPEQYVWHAPHSSLVSDWGLTCGEAWKVSLANAAFFIGYLVGSVLFGPLADRRGRRTCLVASNAASALVALGCASSGSFPAFVAWRSAQGCAVAGVPVAAYVLATESVGAACRGRAGTGSQLVYHAGEWLLPLVALWLQSWRGLCLAMAAWAAVTTVLAALCPESPRWLLLHGRQAEARRALEWLARLNGRELPPGLPAPAPAGEAVAAPAGAEPDGPGGLEQGLPDAAAAAEQADEDSAALLLGGSKPGARADCAAQPDQRGGAWRPQPKQCSAAPKRPDQPRDSLAQLFCHHLLAPFFWVSACVCTSMAFGFFCLNLLTEHLQGSLYLNFLLTSAGEVPAALLGAAAIDHLGRRVTIAAGLLATGLASLACALLPVSVWSTVLASVAKSACSGSWALAYIYAAELLPTSIRSAALAATNQASRLGGAAAPVAVFLGQRQAFAVVGLAALATAALLRLLPETLGKPQPDTVAHLEELYGSSTAQQQPGAQPADSPARAACPLDAAPPQAEAQPQADCCDARQPDAPRWLRQGSAASRGGATVPSSLLHAVQRAAGGGGWRRVPADDAAAAVAAVQLARPSGGAAV